MIWFIYHPLTNIFAGRSEKNVYRNDSNKRPGRLFNFRRSSGGAYSGGGAYLNFSQTPQSDSIKTQNFDNNLNKNNNKDLKYTGILILCSSR